LTSAASNAPGEIHKAEHLLRGSGGQAAEAFHSPRRGRADAAMKERQNSNRRCVKPTGCCFFSAFDVRHC